MKRIIQILVSPHGVTLAIATLIATCFSAAIYFKLASDQLRQSQLQFEERQIRNGFVAIGDLHRVTLIVLQALQAGTLSDDNIADLRAASDFLYVRAESLERSLRISRVVAAPGDDAIAGMREIVGVIDRAVANGAPEIQGLARDILPISDETQRRLLTFLDEMRAAQETVTRHQSRTLEIQTYVLWGFLFAMTVIGSTALLFLRRELVAREQRARAEQRAEFLAYFDSLTRLPNRIQFHDAVRAGLREGQEATLLFMDLDNFKGINDTMGHAMGDAVLVAVAERLSALTGEAGGIAARLAGDEFAAFLPTTDTAALFDYCRSVVASCAQPVEFEGDMITPGISIGLATTTHVAQSAEASFETMARAADFALYASKSARDRRFTLFDDALEAQLAERRAIIEDLPDAILNDELDVYLQPKVFLPGGEVYGFEALVRWDRSGRTMPPDEFIQFAEASGVVVDIDLSVLRQATGLLADWNAANGTGYSLSVNLSALHFNTTTIAADIAAILDDTGFDPGLLTLEITETVQLKNWHQVSETLVSLRRLGCRIAIDDFGTGYSSLVYLRAIMADELKIDKSLADEIDTSDEGRFIFDAVVDLARSLRMDIVIEGVETPAQAEVLWRMGCDRVQGFLYGRPLPAAEALAAASRPPRHKLAQAG